MDTLAADSSIVVHPELINENLIGQLHRQNLAAHRNLANIAMEPNPTKSVSVIHDNIRCAFSPCHPISVGTPNEWATQTVHCN
mmetsp:Transcript_14096/g.30247  ORF Transcript_14096/g.30247 Transcript_14096/m.30247 type:complete len:83 (+) Transcript_14096:86-334(+)